MECNKEEAEKCKAISEASLKRLDLAAARKFSLKAKQLFPELDGLAQLSSILDVYIAAHRKLRNGESNWYAILQVDFQADENTIRKQYRKLALFLHPDKNKVFGAEAAFKHISEAWSVLSDGKKKSDYDKRWFAQMTSHPARPPHTSPAVQARGNISKQKMHGVRQSQQHMHPHQLHRQAHQGQSHVHHQQGPQGQGQVPANDLQRHAPERQGSGKVHAQQRGPSHANAHQQGQTRMHQQQVQWQGTAHANQQQRQGQASTQQQGQAQPCQQQQEGQTQAQQQVEKCASPQHREENFHAHLQQRHGQPHPHQQERQDQGDACHHQQQAHTQKQRQIKHPTQGEGLALQQEERGQVGQTHTHQQQQQGQAHALQRGKVHVQQQGQSRDYHQQKVQANTHAKQQERGEGIVSAQRQHQEHVAEQGQGQEHGHQQQGQGEDCAHRQHEEQGAERKQAYFSKPAFAQDKSVFWTACPHCKMQLEYETIYVNKNLCCPMCYKPFVSKEIEPIQGAILWQRPMQEHKEASEKDAGNKFCTVDESECIPEAHPNIPEVVDCDKKAMRDETCNTSKEEYQKTTEATVCAEIGTKKQEQKGKVGIRKTFGVHKIQPSIKVVTNQECSRERRSLAASACINRSGVEDKVSMPFVQMTEATSEQTACVGNMAKKTNKLHQYDSRVRNLNSAGSKETGTSAVPISASRTLDEQTISEATEQKVSVITEKNNSGDDCNSRVRTRNTAKIKEIGGPRANMIRYVADRARALLDRKENVANMERQVNDVDHSNPRVRTGHSARLKENGGSKKGSSSSILGSPEMESPQFKRKLVSSTIDDLESFGTTKRLRGMSNEVEPEWEFYHESEGNLPKDSKSSDRSSLLVDVADGSPDECEMEVPDADFYNFDEDRTERHFAVGQIWATYDDDDGMPRYYARVNKILSEEPFKLQMNWLEARNPTNETLAWLEAGFQHSCGDFKLGSVYMADQVSTFSHLMMVDKMSKGGYKIFPRKGDVWAVYKEWEFLKVRDDHRGYEMVEIMATYDEKKGVKVAPLFKVAGFKTVFERKPGEEYMRWIPLLEIRRFSHQVPAHPVMAGKTPGIQVDCLEIDPASTPMNLIIGEQ